MHERAVFPMEGEEARLAEAWNPMSSTHTLSSRSTRTESGVTNRLCHSALGHGTGCPFTNSSRCSSGRASG